MKLTNVVAQHGFVPSDLGQIDNALLYQRQNSDGAIELLCVQKLGEHTNNMRVGRVTLLVLPGPQLIQMGTRVDKIIGKYELEDYLNLTLAPASANIWESIF